MGESAPLTRLVSPRQARNAINVQPMFVATEAEQSASQSDSDGILSKDYDSVAGYYLATGAYLHQLHLLAIRLCFKPSMRVEYECLGIVKLQGDDDFKPKLIREHF